MSRHANTDHRYRCSTTEHLSLIYLRPPAWPLTTKSTFSHRHLSSTPVSYQVHSLPCSTGPYPVQHVSTSVGRGLHTLDSPQSNWPTLGRGPRSLGVVFPSGSDGMIETQSRPRSRRSPRSTAPHQRFVMRHTGWGSFRVASLCACGQG